MAYSKQTWTDDVSAVTGARMTHIEQGIYDNSLATDKINPSGTATTTAEIEEGQINDVIGFKSLKLKGQTSQYTTTGKNLLSLTNGTYTNSGITGVVNNGVITLNGTASANSFLSIPINSTFQANKSYAISANNTQTIGGGKSTAYACIRLSTAQSDDTEADVLFNVANNSIAITKTSETVYTYFRVRTGSGLVYNNFVIKPQIEQATSATSYEQYTGGKASPNPDYPQDVNNVSGDNVVRISNKNLIEYSFKGYNINSQGKFETGGTTLDFDVHIAKVKAGTTYTITPATNVIAYFDEKPTITSQAYNNTREVITSTNRLTPTRSGYIAMRTATSNTAQVEKGTSVTSFVAHQGNNFEVDLPVENLLNLTDGTYTNNGIEAVVRDGEITLNGTAGANNSYINIPYSQTIEPKIEYTLSLNNDFTTSNTSDGLRLSTNDDTRGSFTALNRTKTFTFQNALASNQLTLRLMAGSTVKNGKMKPQLEKGSIAHAYTPYGVTPIYQGKIGTYCNDIRKYNGKWYWHKEIEKLILNGSEAWTLNETGTNTLRFVDSTLISSKPAFNKAPQFFMNNTYQQYNGNTEIASVDVEGIAMRDDNKGFAVRMLKSRITNKDGFIAWLSTNKPEIYYVLATPIDEEITYEPLIRQLDELYNSGLYDVTNINQDNSGEAFVLDIEACKNNINGIVEYIRR